MQESHILVRPSYDISSHIEHVDDFVSTELAVQLSDFLDNLKKYRGYSKLSTKASSTSSHPPVAWWGLEWMYVYPDTSSEEGENHLTRTPENDPLSEPLKKLLSLVKLHWDFQPNQIQVNRYRPGEGLVWHSDLDTLSWLTKHTVTIALGAPRDVVFAHFPDNWKEKKIVGMEPGEGLIPEFTIRSEDRSATMLTVDGQRSIAHAVLPGPGLRYGITFREYRMW